MVKKVRKEQDVGWYTHTHFPCCNLTVKNRRESLMERGGWKVGLVTSHRVVMATSEDPRQR